MAALIALRRHIFVYVCVFEIDDSEFVNVGNVNAFWLEIVVITNVKCMKYTD